MVSTHYRQGPEHKFPAAHDDVYASYREHAKAAPLSAGGMKWFFTHYPRSDAERQGPRITLSKGNLK